MKSFTGTEVFRIEAEASEEALSRKVLEESFDRLLAANGPALTRLAAAYTDTPSDRDDLLQEIALALWQALPRFRGECSERTFLFRIATNRAIAYLARRRAQRLSSPARQGGVVIEEEIEAKDGAPNPEAGLAQEQRVERLRSAIRRLPLTYRQAITLSLEGLGYREIAEVLGISESNVGARLTRARQILREFLEKRQ
jgi:RNA polymerase sigma factor (sigma-70 family)